MGDRYEERGWQPIATAPKDGTQILTWGCLHDDGSIDMGERPAMQISRWIAMYESWVSGDWGSNAPIMWRPLPAPPTDTGRETVTPRDTGGGDGLLG